MDNNITPEFEYLVKTESNDFSSILDVMMHSKKEVGRQFLNLIVFKLPKKQFAELKLCI